MKRTQHRNYHLIRLFLLAGLVVFTLIIIITPKTYAKSTQPGWIQSGTCQADSVSVSPDNVKVGTLIVFEGSGKCSDSSGFIRFYLDGQLLREFDYASHSMTFDTTPLTPGQHNVQIQVSNGDWNNAAKKEVGFTLTGDPAEQPGQCWADSASVSPDNAKVGTLLVLYGEGHCLGAQGHLRFFVDGKQVGEYDNATHSMTLDSTYLTPGQHHLKIQVTAGDWSQATAQEAVFTLSGDPEEKPGQCWADSTSVSPDNAKVGTLLVLYGEGHCLGAQGHLRFFVDGKQVGEFDNASHSMTYDSTYLTPGQHKVKIQVTAGDWAQATSKEAVFSLTGNPDEKPGQCWADAASVSPENAKVGTLLVFTGEGHCQGAQGYLRFFVDGKQVGEYDNATHSMTYDSTYLTPGQHQLKIQVSAGDWNQATNRETAFTLAGDPNETPGQCWADAVSVSPENAKVGTLLVFTGEGHCLGVQGHLRFIVDGKQVGEYDNASHSMTYDSTYLAPGQHNLKIQVTADDWSKASTKEKVFTLTGDPSETPGQCWADSVSVSLHTAKTGTLLVFYGTGHCLGTQGYLRFFVDGKQVGEFDNATHSMTFDTTYQSVGRHTVQIQVTAGDWAQASSKETTFSITSDSNLTPGMCVIDGLRVSPDLVLPGTLITLEVNARCLGTNGKSRLFVDGALQKEFDNATHSLAFDTTGLALGTHKFEVKVTGGEWNSAVSSEITFTLGVKPTEKPAEPPKPVDSDAGSGASGGNSGSGGTNNNGSTSGSSTSSGSNASSGNPPPFTSPFVELKSVDWSYTPKPVDWEKWARDVGEVMDVGSQTTSVANFATGNVWIDAAVPAGMTGLQGGAELVQSYYSKNGWDAVYGSLDLVFAASVLTVSIVAGTTVSGGAVAGLSVILPIAGVAMVGSFVVKNLIKLTGVR